jgi:DNA-binding CsgD family transcriptional regulator
MELRIMSKTIYSKFTKEHINIAKYIFKGLTISQIAQKMCCSNSNVSYKMNALFKKYNVKNRFQFVISVFSEIVNSHKNTIDSKNYELAKLEVELEKLKEITQNLIKNKNNKENYSYWEQEAQKQL